MTRWSLPHGATIRIVLVRHGEPDERIRGRFYGRLNIGLSMRGRDQMHRTRRLLREAQVSAIYSSPSRRPFESAALLAGRRA